MKKLLVFLSIFAVLFVSTIRPLQAEYLPNDFSLLNGNTYYFILSNDSLYDETLIAETSLGSTFCQIVLRYEGSLDTMRFDIQYKTSSNSSTQYARVSLNYLGTIDSYVTDNSTLEDALVFSFVWSMLTFNSFEYDDSLFGFDTENPIPPVSIYDTIYSIINKFVFGNFIESGSHQDLIATLLSSIAVVFVFALPFLLVWKVIKIIMG